MSEYTWSRQKYPTTKCSQYIQALKARGSLMVWFEKDMQWHAPLSGKRGPNRSYSDAAIQCCLSFKVLLNLALRQTIGLLESLRPFMKPAMKGRFCQSSHFAQMRKGAAFVEIYTVSAQVQHIEDENG